MNSIYCFFFSLIISSLLSAPNELNAAIKTWVGNTADWSLASNWNPASLPNSTDDIIIPTLPSGGNMPILNNGNFTINKLTINISGLLTINGGTLIFNSNGLINGTLNINSGTFDLNTNNKNITVDGGVINQAGGIVSTRDLELKNGGTYNQTNGEFQISHDLKVPTGNTFNGTGGTVHFTGVAGGAADYTGNVQFHNMLIDFGADYNANNNNDNIKISGNFINNNPNLDNDKGTFTFNGTSPQTIYSASTPPATRTAFGNLVISNPAGVRLLSDLGVDASFTYNSGGFLITDIYILYVNGVIYDGPLPVELLSFSATTIGSTVKLNWITSTEVNNYGFEIERSVISNGVRNPSWGKIGFVNGNGNSSSPKSYYFVDDKVRAGKYSYRLKQIDNDGQFEYSKSIEVDLGSPKKYELSQNYPNPFNPSTTIRFNLPEAGNVILTLYNILGQEIRTLVNEFKESGVHTINLDASDLNSGIYVYKIESGSFIQTRKMTLVK